ncbi:MAG: short-chain dehydrogenase [Microbacteriaceae bacterium]|jgi:NAD(P)-dependent dehydrogenase (short-subunit alcohol dehydrogenase family)|nr:short-chain dehydrogenase [Microbacteriaceae bacterium]
MKTIVITGASSGIGAEAAARLASEGWDVAVVGRNPERTAKVAASVGGTPFVADYDRLGEVRDLATALLARYPRIDVLANNAGGLVSTHALTVDGNERGIQHNHLAPFLLTNLLLPRLLESQARVISTSSFANLAGSVRLDDLNWEKRPWLGGWPAYGTGKLATILFMRELAKRTGLDAYSFHPGYVSTAFGADSGFITVTNRLRPGGFGIPAAVGAEPLVLLATGSAAPAANGSYYDRLTPNGRTRKSANDDTLAAALWERSATIAGL